MTMNASITSGQETQYRRILEDAARKAGEVALKKFASVAGTDFQRVLARGDEVADAIIDAVVAKTRELTIVNQQVVDFVRFYRDEFGIDLEVEKLVIPRKREGFDRLLVIVQGLSIQLVFDRCKQKFGAWKYTHGNLDEAVPTNDRDPKTGSYAIWVRDRVEADDEHKNRSARQLEQAKIAGITLLERLVYELVYFAETGKHLDVKNWTLCSGSRLADGSVPYVFWYSDDSGMSVHWYNVDFADDDLRSREVVAG